MARTSREIVVPQHLAPAFRQWPGTGPGPVQAWLRSDDDRCGRPGQACGRSPAARECCPGGSSAGTWPGAAARLVLPGHLLTGRTRRGRFRWWHRPAQPPGQLPGAIIAAVSLATGTGAVALTPWRPAACRAAMARVVAARRRTPSPGVPV